MKTQTIKGDRGRQLNFSIISIIGIIAVTGLILLIPAVMTQISSEWDWDAFDFIIITVLLLTAGTIFELLRKNVRNRTTQLMAGITVVAVTMWLWAELAVGIFTNWGS